METENVMALHVTVYRCEQCGGPVFAVSVGNAGPVGDMVPGEPPPVGPGVEPIGNPTCMRCGHEQSTIVPDTPVVHVPPIPWD